MRKIFLLLFLGCSVSALAQTEPQTTDPQPYYFSDELKRAVSECTPYSEDLFEKNPDMQKQAEAMLKMFSDRFDLSSSKMILTVQGPQEDKCQVSLKYDYGFPIIQEYSCALTREAQDQLVSAMNDQSTEVKTRTIETEMIKTTQTDREFNLTISEMTMKYCRLVEKEPSKEEQEAMEQKMKETMKKMMAFSEEFKNSLKTCTPNKETVKVMGMDVHKVEIKGKEKDKCHIASHGFHIFLDDDELSLSGFDELTEMLSNEQKAIYKPSYKYQGILFALNECQHPTEAYNAGQEELLLGDIKIRQGGADSSYENGICQILLPLSMERNGKSENYSLRCDIPGAKVSSYTQPYAQLIQQYAPKKSASSDGTISFFDGQRNDEVTKADKALLLKMNQDRACRKLSDLPPVNSKGCSNATPLKDWDGRCHSCAEVASIKLSMKNENECSKVCSGVHGRPMRILKMGDCVLESCPKDRPLKDHWGDCYACDYDGAVEGEGCSRCPNRTIKGDKCVIADCTNRPLLDFSGVCYPCTTTEDVQVEKGKCTSVCPNRKEDGGWKYNETISLTHCVLND